MLVKDVMTASPATGQLDTPIQEALQLMRDYDARHLPILDGEKLVGVISDRDVTGLFGINDIFDKISIEDVQEVFLRPVTIVLKTRFLVEADVICTHPDSPIIDAIRLLIDQKISSLPVVDPEDGRLVGIITPVDILDAAAHLFSP